MTKERKWETFYEATKNREPRALFVEGLKLVPKKLPKVGLDIGFGSGNETRALLDLGWEVTAIDYEDRAADILKEKIGDNPNVRIVTASYEEVDYHPACFVHAGFSLPFCHPSYFNDVWIQITRAITPGGIFCGQLFGQNDAWATNDNMTFHHKSEVETLLSNFDIIKLEETEGQLATATGDQKYWHYYDIIARKLVASD